MEEEREDLSPSLSDTVCFPSSLSLRTYTSALLTTRAPEFYRNKVNPYWPVWAPRQDKVQDGIGQFRRWCLEGLLVLREGKEKEGKKEKEEACCEGARKGGGGRYQWRAGGRKP